MSKFKKVTKTELISFRVDTKTKEVLEQMNDEKNLNIFMEKIVQEYIRNKKALNIHGV